MSAPQPSPFSMSTTWDVVASGYAEGFVPFFTLYAEEALRQVAPDPSAHLLDIACGPGTLALLAASQVTRVTAIDFSAKMIAELGGRVARAGLSNVDAAVMDAHCLAFGDESFDVAFCLFGFMFFPDRGRAFREMRRVLRPSGTASVVTWAPIERRHFFRVGFEAMAEALPHITAMPKGALQLPGECIDEMTAAGFSKVTTTSLAHAIHVESAEHYLQLMERSGAGISLVRRRYGEAWSTPRARLLDALRRRIPSGGAKLGAEAILSLAIR